MAWLTGLAAGAGGVAGTTGNILGSAAGSAGSALGSAASTVGQVAQGFGQGISANANAMLQGMLSKGHRSASGERPLPAAPASQSGDPNAQALDFAQRREQLLEQRKRRLLGEARWH